MTSDLDKKFPSTKKDFEDNHVFLGKYDEKPTMMFLKNNMRTAVVKGMKLYTTEKVSDEADLHYFRDNPKSIPENQQVTVIGCWMNFYGSWITCLYDGLLQPIWEYSNVL